MKHILNSTWSGAAAAVLITSIGLTQSANAVVLRYQEGPNINQNYVGAYEIKLQNFDTGNTYDTPLANGTPKGYSGPFNNTTLVTTGINVLNGLPLDAGVVGAGAVQNAFPGTVSPASNEDAWGIFRVTDIFSVEPDNVTKYRVWSAANSNTPVQTEITGIFYGLQDYFVAPGPFDPNNSFLVNSVGLIADFYEQNIGISNYDPLQGGIGPLARTTMTDFPTVSDFVGGTQGTRFLTIEGVSGFIHTDVPPIGLPGPSPGFGGSAAQYESVFNPGSLTGQGTAFGNVRAGILGGAQGAQFDTNGVMTPAGTFNGVPNADVKLTFTTAPGAAGWLVSSNDPISGVFVPEPGNVLAGLGCMLPMFGVFFGRRRQRQVAA